MNRGSKLLVASLSITMTMSGWAWLTATQEPLVAETSDTPDVTRDIDSLNLPPPTLQLPVVRKLRGTATPAPPQIPNLADLPVRGLPEVGDPVVLAVPPPPQATNQPPPPPERNHDGGGGGGQSASRPEPQHEKPAPPPKPVRKTKSSH